MVTVRGYCPSGRSHGHRPRVLSIWREPWSQDWRQLLTLHTFVRKHKVMSLDAQFSFSFYLAPSPAHGMAPLSFRVGLSTSVNPT